ncbi:MAG: hypothetical protein LUG50_13345 [Planctomycetaceae bacterium]|nr:hypothetical protein [Planctomycetaceae bacterium]
MVKRFSVSVSEELGQRIHRWKDEISPSAIFQRAMEEVVREKEEFSGRLQDDPALPEVVERLRTESGKARSEYRVNGKSKGIEWAKCASLKNIKHILHEKECFDDLFSQNERIPPSMILDDYVIGAYVKQAWAGDPAFESKYVGNKRKEEVLSPESVLWFEGWLEGVSTFWKEVEKRM